MTTDEGKKSLEDIREFWQSASAISTDADGLRPTARDPYLQRAVEAAMERWLSPSVRLLDVGCGDGGSTLRFARGVHFALGIDYVSAFVEQANAAAASAEVKNARFELADAMDLSAIRAQHGLFDIVIAIRCLINLGNWTNQSKAIGELASCVKPSGLLLISEGWEDGMQGLNLMRARANLPPIKVVDYNLMMRRSAFEGEVRRYFDVVDYASLGLYLFLSRVVQPMLVAPAAPRHDHELNRIAASLQELCYSEKPFHDCDYAGVYVLRRRQ